MFDAFKTAPRLIGRPIVIELRDGRRLRGTLQLAKSENAETLLRKATPFLTVRTPTGDIAINRDNIAALILGDDVLAPAVPTAKPVREAPKQAIRGLREALIYGFDPCRILDVRPGATREEIKTAWRKRISQCHPDRVRAGGASDNVVAAAQRQAAIVNSAYHTLMAQKSGSA